MVPFSEKELTTPLTVSEQAERDAAVRARAQEGLDSGRMHRVERPCVADSFTMSSTWLYMRTHDWVWALLTMIIAVVVIGIL